MLWKLWNLQKEWIGRKIGCILRNNFIQNLFWPHKYLGSYAHVRHENSRRTSWLIIKNWIVLTNFGEISQSWCLENSFIILCEYVNKMCQYLLVQFKKRCVWNAPEVYLKQQFFI